MNKILAGVAFGLCAFSSATHAKYMEWTATQSVYHYDLVNGVEVPVNSAPEIWETKIVYKEGTNKVFQVRTYNVNSHQQFFDKPVPIVPYTQLTGAQKDHVYRLFDVKFSPISENSAFGSTPSIGLYWGPRNVDQWYNYGSFYGGSSIKFDAIYADLAKDETASLDSDLTFMSGELSTYYPGNVFSTAIRHNTSRFYGVFTEHKEAAVPEPAPLGLLALGLSAIALLRRRQADNFSA